jgi:hypothetical protein
MTTETTTAADTTNEAAPVASNTAAAPGATTLLGADPAGNTAEGAEAGAKGAEAGNEGDAEKVGGEKPKTEDANPEGPPEKYEFTMPEGVGLDAGLAERAEPILRELNLSNDQANKLATLIASERVSEAQRQSDAYTQQVKDWGDLAAADPEFGGASFEKNAPIAQRAIAQFGTPELKALMENGLGNHPEMIRFAYRVGKALGEDGGVDGNKASTPKSAADVLFDHPTSKPKR